MSVFDLHVHTTRGSSDSGLTPEQLIDRALEIGLDGVCLTEHGGGWNGPEIDRAFSASGLTVIGGIEAATDAGHVLVYGMRSYVEGMHTIAGLRRAADRAGAVMVSAHPFRNLFNSNPNGVNLLYPDSRDRPDAARDALRHPLFSVVDEMEVANGGNHGWRERIRRGSCPRAGAEGNRRQRRPLAARPRALRDGLRRRGTERSRPDRCP